MRRQAHLPGAPKPPELRLQLRLYNTDLELALWLGDDTSILSAYLEDVSGRLKSSGATDAAPPTENRALVVSFDAAGRRRAWFESEAGRPPEVPHGHEALIIDGLEPPDLRGGVVVVAIHYSFTSGDVGQGMRWVPWPGDWLAIGQSEDGSASAPVYEVVRRILKTEPPRRELNPATPVSTAMAEASYEDFLRVYANSQVATVVSGGVEEGGQLRSTQEAPITLPQAVAPDGTRVILTFADPWAYAEHFGMPFNWLLPGSDMLRVIQRDPSLPAILVNSALAEDSMLIPRESVVGLQLD